MYRILRVIGNNFVSAISNQGTTVVLQGLGIGFNQRKGFLVEDSKIERIYHMDSDVETNKLTELVSYIPHEHISFVASLIDEIKPLFEEDLRPSIYITLTDHLSCAIDRYNKNQLYANALLNEISLFYPRELIMGKNIIKKINKRFDIELTDDEAGFVALHIVNAELSTNMSDMVNLTKIIEVSMKVIRTFFPNNFDKNSFSNSRLIAHLKYLAKEVLNNNIPTKTNPSFRKLLEKQYPQETECVFHVREVIEEEFDHTIDDDELLMLAIQIHRSLKFK